MTITRKSAKAKGRRIVYETKDILLKKYPSLKEDDILIPGGSQPGEDLILSPKARELFPFSMEMKYCEKLNIWSSMEQCEGNAKNNIPLLVFKRNRSNIYCTLKLDDLMKLL